MGNHSPKALSIMGWPMDSPTYNRTRPNNAPSAAITLASNTSNPKITRGRAPIALKMAISRRRSFKLEKIVAIIPIRAVITTMADTPISAVSAIPTICHNSCNATPGRIASKGSSAYSLMARCNPKTLRRPLTPTSAAVTAYGFNSIWRRASAGVDCSCIWPPPCQSTWIASIARRPTMTVRSTGVPVFSRMPETRKG